MIRNGDLTNKTILVTGGTGSLGKTLVRRLLMLGATNEGPKKIIVFSRDEAKQHFMRMEYLNRSAATDEIIYSNFQRMVEFRIGDVRDYNSVANAVRDADIVVNAAALKQVPSCEYFVEEAVKTNVLGPCNIVQAIKNSAAQVELVVGISTDKACKPINVMGMTKALQERVFISANIGSATRFVCVRYGNVLASRGSVVPLFLDQIKNGGPVTITHSGMTRFLLTLEQAVDTVFAAMTHARRGEMFVPIIPSARLTDIAAVLISGRNIAIKDVGVRPGEKIHELLVSEEEGGRTTRHPSLPYYVISSSLPEVSCRQSHPTGQEYSSADGVMDREALASLLREHGLHGAENGEVLR